MRTKLALLFALTTIACSGGGGDDDPLDVVFGETTFVVVVNPVVNDVNEASMPAPGEVHAGVTVAVDEGPARDTNSAGIAVLAPVAPGTRTLSLSGSGVSGSAAISIREHDLHEVALATDESGTQVMSDVDFAFGGTVVEVTPETPISQVNDELSRSNIIVFFHGGHYEGDLEFSGSNVTLFGAGFYGGEVLLDGNISMPGSNNRIRGAVILGDLDVSGSDGSVSFSRIEGAATFSGSDTTLLHNELCGAIDISGSGLRVLNNLGLAPLGEPPGCP
jgi:hypothetical protein